MEHEEKEGQEAQVASLTTAVGSLLRQLEQTTAEIRRTNDTVQALHTDQKLTSERVERLSREVWTPDSASRIRSCELHIRGLYALLGFLAVTVGTPIVATFLRSLVGVPK